MRGIRLSLTAPDHYLERYREPVRWGEWHVVDEGPGMTRERRDELAAARQLSLTLEAEKDAIERTACGLDVDVAVVLAGARELGPWPPTSYGARTCARCIGAVAPIVRA